MCSLASDKSASVLDLLFCCVDTSYLLHIIFQFQKLHQCLFSCFHSLLYRHECLRFPLISGITYPFQSSHPFHSELTCPVCLMPSHANALSSTERAIIMVQGGSYQLILTVDSVIIDLNTKILDNIYHTQYLIYNIFLTEMDLPNRSRCRCYNCVRFPRSLKRFTSRVQVLKYSNDTLD